MHPNILKIHVYTLILLLVLCAGGGNTYAQSKKGGKNSRAQSSQTVTQKGSKNQGGKNKSSKKKSGAKTQKKETSADVKKKQAAVQKEITLTKEQIRANDLQVKKNLAALGKLEGDIDAGKKRVAEADGRVSSLKQQISQLEQNIAVDEGKIYKLRAEYLKAVKAMRSKKNGKSTLAFIFSSSSFNQAMRRMRYLREFSQWREGKTSEIETRLSDLKSRKEQLSQTKVKEDKALGEQLQAQKELQNQYARQDAVVVELKKNGQALKTHLSNKQQEANALKARVSALIAEEVRKAEAERKAREAREAAAREAAAKAAEEKAAMAAAEKEKAEKEKISDKDKTHKDKSAKEKPVKETSTKEKQAKEKQVKKSENKESASKPKSEEKVSKESDKNYAEARGRKPRSDKQESPKVTVPGGNFESMRGSLPRPVSGAFRVTSRFGRHALPDLPDVMYDNPGIDAEVAPGATAQAVYVGKVSGVYMIPGYSTVVIVNHGGYYTVYGNIASASVKVGDVVKQGTALGRLAPNEEDSSRSTIHFEVWKNRDKLDPLSWIR